MFRYALALSLLAVSPAAGALLPPGCWQYFVRDDAGPPPDPRYVANQRLAQEVFRRWWRDPTTMSFAEMMLEAHRAALSTPYSVPAGVMDPATIVPGVFRSGLLLPLDIDEETVDLWGAEGAALPADPDFGFRQVEWRIAIDSLPPEAFPEIAAFSSAAI